MTPRMLLGASAVLHGLLFCFVYATHGTFRYLPIVAGIGAVTAVITLVVEISDAVSFA